MRLIRPAREEDLPRIQELFESARAALKAQGVDQWQDGDYPGTAEARADLESGTGFVLEEDGQVLATACIAFGREPTYEVIRQGCWAADPAEYGFLHRLAVAPEGKGRGLAGALFDELERRARERGLTVLRGDTHRDNLPMQRALAKAGFVCRGEILLENGDPRLAYERVLRA